MKKIIFLLLAFALFSCEHPFDPKLDGMNSRYSIEGYVTSDSINQRVKFFYTKSYDSDNHFEPVTSATVSVAEINNGVVINSYDYSYNDSLKCYVSDIVYKGIAGNSYRLLVHIGADEITAVDTMKQMVYMDSIRFKLTPSFKIFDDGSYKEIYLIDVVCFAQEPAESGDAYIWNTYWNDTLLSDSLRKKVFQNDMMVNGNYITASPVSYSSLFPVDTGWNTSIPIGTKITVSTSHVSNIFYTYLVDIMLSTEWTAGPFSGPPANPQGNIYLNGKKENVYGFFATESISRNTVFFNPLEIILPQY